MRTVSLVAVAAVLAMSFGCDRAPKKIAKKVEKIAGNVDGGSPDKAQKDKKPKSGGGKGGASTGGGDGWQGAQIRDAKSRKAVCNNGDPAVMFWERASSAAAKDKWIVYFKGGGTCPNLDLCKKRWKDQPGLMKPPKVTMKPDTEGMFNASKSLNPEFHDWNKVYVDYCSSDGWVGDRAASKETNDWHFRGYRIAMAAIEDLQDPKDSGRNDLDDADEIIFWGASVGSHAIKHHVDRFAGMFSKARVVGLNDSAYAPVVVDSMETARIANLKTAYELHAPVVDDSCKAGEKKNPWKCLDWEYVLDKYTSTPTFVYMDQFDSTSLKAQQIKGKESKDAKKFQKTLIGMLDKHDGVFSTQEGIHVIGTKSKYFNLKVKAGDGQKLSMHDVFTNWYFDRSGPKKVIPKP